MSRTELKVVLCGGSGTGKSGLIMKLITGKFMSTYDPTIEDSYNKILSVDNDEIFLDILDTAGQEQFASMQQFWFREGEIFLIVYSITSKRSFNQIRHFARKIADSKGFNLSETNVVNTNININNDKIKLPSKPIIIVGNKADLEDQRQVSYDDAKRLADIWNVPFFECSVFKEQNLDEMWTESVRLSRRIQQENIAPTQRKQKQNKNKTCCCIKQKNEGADIDNNNKPKKATDNIQFFAVKSAPSDTIQPPVLALKNFRISRKFHIKRFVITMLCGLLLPIVIVFQTIAFLIYNENKEAWYFPEHYDYDTVHHSILLDYLGLMVGREPGQDPETVKDRKWFLRQNTGQKIVRVILCLLVAFAFTILYYNISQFNNKEVSAQETVGPLFLFWLLWFLLSAWIAFEPRINPPLPPLLLSRLRAITLIFGEYFSHRTSAYKFLRSYAAARQENNFLSAKQYITVIILSAIYALIPGITRKTVGDENDGITDKVFWTKQNWMIEIGAFLVNFLLVGIFIFSIEVQYSKHFDNYREWMRDLTLLLSKEQLGTNNDDNDDIERSRKKSTMRNVQEMIEMEKSRHLTPHKFGRDFSKHLFLSLTRRSNALGWLEIRSFLAIEGKLLFGEQELPTLFLMVVTLSLSFFVVFRVYFESDYGNAEQSVLFNGSVILMIICLVSLMRIAITGYQFKNLQETQERLLGEQKLWMRCNVAQNIGVETIDVKEAAFGVNTIYDIGFSQEMQIDTKKQIDNNEKEEKEEKEEEEEEDIKYDNDDENESKPLIKKINSFETDKTYKKQKTEDVLVRVDTTNWYTYNFGFLDDMLFIVRKKDIYPRLFKIRLDSVLVKAIAGVLFSSVITLFKVFVSE